MEEFATNVLGMEAIEHAEDGTVYLRMDEHHHRVALAPSDADDMSYVGWQTPNREQYEDVKAKLLAAGVEYAQGTPDELANRHVSDMVKFEVSGLNMEVYVGPHVLFEQPFRPGRPITRLQDGRTRPRPRGGWRRSGRRTSSGLRRSSRSAWASSRATRARTASTASSTATPASTRQWCRTARRPSTSATS